MNTSHQAAAASRQRPAGVVLRALPSARDLAALALVDTPLDPRPDQREHVSGATESFACGPGWFDSSWELGRGLLVLEGLPADATVNEWIEASLRT